MLPKPMHIIRSTLCKLLNSQPPLLSYPSFLRGYQSEARAGSLLFNSKTSARLTAVAALIAVVADFAPLSAKAATIYWSTPQNISGDSDVTNSGTALYAYTGGNAATVNGVSFTAGTGFAAWGNVSFTSGFTASSTNAFNAAFAPFTSLSPAYTNVLVGAAYGGTAAGTVTLNGLTAGHDYSVQIWVNDPRSGTPATRNETVTNTGVIVPNTYATLSYNIYQSLGGAGQWSVGYFSATTNNQAVTLVPGATTAANASAQLNAISVRDLGLSQRIWLGSSGTAWGMVGNWSPALLPIPSDTIIFNASSTGTLGTMLDTSYTVGTLLLSNAPSAVSIGADANTLTINGGINLFGASDQLTLNDAVVLGGSQTWTNNGSVTVNAGISGSAALTIAGNGRVTFTQPATYLSKTTISGGTLALSGSGSLTSANITVAGGAKFDVSATASTFALSGATLTNSSAGALLCGSSDCTSGTISMTYDGANAPFIQTNGTLTLSSSTVINLNILGAVLGGGNYPIIAAATGANPGSVAFSDSAPSVTITGNGSVGAASLQIIGNALVLVVASPAVWTGNGLDGLWNTAGNWNPASEPGVGDAILFNNSSLNNLSSISQNDPSGGAQWGVSVLNPPSAVTIGGPNPLAIYGGGLNLSAASQNLTVSAPLVVNANQNWLVTNTRTLTISGPVTTASGGNITISGGGKVQMGATHVLDGLTNASPGAGDFIVNSTLDLNGNSQVMNGLSGPSSGTVDNSGVGAITLALGGNTDSTTYSGVIRNTGGALALDVFGGSLTLNSSSNTYSGGTTFESGSSLSFPSSTAKYGTGPVTFKPGSTSYAGNITFTNPLSLDACWLRVGGGNLSVQNWSGPVTVADGFQISGDGGAGGVTLSGPINIGSGGISITNTGGNGPNEGYGVSLTGDLLSGVISGSGGITYYCNGGSSRLTVSGANTYSGGTIVNGTSNGKLSVAGGVNPFSTGAVTLNAGAIIEAAPSSGTVTNALILNGGILEAEPQYNNYNQLFWTGPITMTADSSFVQQATGALNSNQSSGVNVSGSLNINGFTLTCSSPVACYGGNTISGSISGTGNILENGNNVLAINGSNTFAGTFRSVIGTISVGNTYALQNATLDMNATDAGGVNLGANCVIGELTGSRNLSLGVGTVSIGNNNTPSTYSGTLSGNSLIKIGTGTLTLSANAYTGNTTVTGGTLSLAQPSLALSSMVTIAGGAILDLEFSPLATNVVTALVLNGVSQPNGVYNSGNSGGLITGTGAIQVATPDVWTGAWSSEWSANILTSPKNWTSNGLAADFVSNNVVLFDDTLKSNNVVIITNSVYPASVTFNNNNTNYTIGGSSGIAGTASFYKNGAGSVILTNNNTYTGNTYINNNRLTIATAGKLGVGGTNTGAIYLGSGATLEYSSSSAQNLAGPITGAGGLLKDGPTKSDLTLSSTANTYSGQTIITNGRVFVSSPGNLGGGTTIVQTNAGQLYISAATTLNNPMNISSIGYPEADANNNYDGAIRCDLASTLLGTITLSGNARIGNYAASGVTFTIGGQITGNYGIDFFGMNNGANSRNFLLSNPGNNFTGNASITCSDYASARTGASTTLKLGASEVIPNGNGRGNVVFNGADANHLTLLEMNGFNETLNGVSNVSATGAVIQNTSPGVSTLTIGDANTNSTFTGVIKDGGAGSGKYLALTKIGSGTVTLTGLNAYNGNTTVSNGTLVIAQPTLAAGSTVTVAGGAVLQLNYTGGNLVSALVLNGVNEPAGTYNSSNSGGLITGLGSIVVGQPSVWTGGFSTEWSVNTIASPKNWASASVAADYANGNPVLFDDTLTGNNLVNIAVANVTPTIVTFNNSKTNYTLQGSSAIAGSAALAKNGTAALTILNANTYSGGTVVSAGTLEADATSALGTGAVTMNGGLLTNNVSATLPNTINLAAATTVAVRSGQGLTFNGAITNSSALTLAGGGTVVLNGANTTTGNNIIIGGTTVKFAGTGSSSFPPSGTVYVLNNAGANGVGTIDLNGTTQTSTAYVPFMYSTTTTLTNGTLIDNAAYTTAGDSHEDYNFMGTITLAPNGNYISNKRFIIGLNSAWVNFTTTINSLNNTTNGSLTWGGDNGGSMNYVGVTAGVAPTLNINGGTVNFNNATNGTGNGYLNVGVNTATSKGTININGATMNVGTWMKLGGTYNTITGQSGTAILTVTNGAVAIGGGSDAAYNGVLFMDGGNGDSTANTGQSTLTLNNGGSLTVAQIQAGNAGTNTINLNGGTIIAGVNASNLFLSATPNQKVNLQAGGGTINTSTNNITVGALLSSTGGLTKTGAGTLTLTNANTYGGTTIISAGTLLANNPTGSATSTNTVVINNGGTLGGTGTIAGSVTNNAGGILSPGVAGSGTLTLTNKLTLLAGSTNTFAVNGTTPTNTKIVLTAPATVKYGGVLNIVANGAFTVGQTFTLFSGTSATNTSNFASIAGSPGAGKAFSFTNGVLSVVSGGPTLTSVTPNPVTGSSYAVTLTLTGSGFTGAGVGSVLLTNVSASTGASYTPTAVIGDTSITVSFVPGTATNNWNATVVNGGASVPLSFTVAVPAKVNINTGNLNSAGAGKLVMSGTGGVAGNSYSVQSTTNLAPPVVWSPVVTNVFGGGGSFAYTNTVNPGMPQLFLRIAQ